MGSNSEDLRELPNIQKPILIFNNLKTDLDKLKSQIDNLKIGRASCRERV